MLQPPARISSDVLDADLAGTALHTDAAGRLTLRAQLDPVRPTLLLFLRHFGCLFCREMVKDARIAADRADALSGGDGEKRYPRVVFVHSASVEQGARFFGRYWPGAPAVSDPQKRLYDAFGLKRGSTMQIFGPRVWSCALRATFKGHGLGKPAGDPWTLPGAFLVSYDARVLHARAFAHIGDLPDFTRYANEHLHRAGNTPGTSEPASNARAEPPVPDPRSPLNPSHV